MRRAALIAFALFVLASCSSSVSAPLPHAYDDDEYASQCDDGGDYGLVYVECLKTA